MRVSVVIAQIRGYQVRIDQLQMALAGVPLGRDEHAPGLAAAQRVFLAAAPLFREKSQTESVGALWPQFWDIEASNDEKTDENGEDASDPVERAGEGGRLGGFPGLGLSAQADDDRPGDRAS